LLLVDVVVEVVELEVVLPELLLEALPLGLAEVSPLVLVLGELLVELALPLGALMLPPLFGLLESEFGVLLLGVWFVVPEAPPVVEVEEPVLGVWAGLDVSVEDGVCVVVDDVDVELDGVCVVCVVVELEDGGDCVSVLGVVDWVSVLGVVELPVVAVLPDVWASIMTLNVNTSATINKAFFMLVSIWGVDGAFGEVISELLCSEHPRPHLHQQIV
jgi:hypothetical protein